MTLRSRSIARLLPLFGICLVVGFWGATLAQSRDADKWTAQASVEILDPEAEVLSSVLWMESPSTWRSVAESEGFSIAEFLKSLEVKQVGNSGVVRISFVAGDWEQAIRAVDGVVHSFIERSAAADVDTQKEIISAHIESLKRRKAALEEGAEAQFYLADLNRTVQSATRVGNRILEAQILLDDVDAEFELRRQQQPQVFSAARIVLEPNPAWPMANGALGALAGVSTAALALWGLERRQLEAGVAGTAVMPRSQRNRLSPVLPISKDGSASGQSSVEAEPVYEPVGSDVARAIKRLVDICLSFGALLLLLPVAGAIAIWIKVTSPGPILFRQDRIGWKGETFKINKFRTMQTNNDDSIHKKYVADMIKAGSDDSEPLEGGIYKLDDPRVTRPGAFLRKYSLDELPQLWNVLLGEMSLVGPRPSLPWEHELYSERHRQRVRAKPGCSGLWQVSGHNRLTVPEMLDLDLEYVDSWTLERDLVILMKTPAVLLAQGDTR